MKTADGRGTVQTPFVIFGRLGRDRRRLPWSVTALLVAAAIILLVKPEWFLFGLNYRVGTGLHILLSFVLVVSIVWWMERTPVHPLPFVVATAGLFLWGRFLANILGLDVPIYSDSHFVPVTLTPTESIELAGSISGGLLAIVAGYAGVTRLIGERRIPVPGDRAHAWPALAAIPLLALGASGTLVAGLQNAAICSQDGYLGLFGGQETDNLLRVGLASQYLLLIAMGLAFASRVRVLIVASVVGIGCYYLMYMAFGVRNGFMAFALFVVWLAAKDLRGWRILWIGAVLVGLFALAQLAISFGCRGDAARVAAGEQAVEEARADGPGEDTRSATSRGTRDYAKGGSSLAARNERRTDDGISQFDGDGPGLGDNANADIFADLRLYTRRLGLQGVGVFAYLQGSSLVYVGMARRLEDYPIHAKVQTFVPGASIVWSRVDPTLGNEDFLFPHHLAHRYSPSLYADGYGIGWSIFSDFFAFSGGRPVTYVLLAVFFGMGLGYVYSAATFSAFMTGALVTVFPKLLLLPRTGLYSIFPYLAAYALLFLSGWIAWNLWQKVRTRRWSGPT